MESYSVLRLPRDHRVNVCPSLPVLLYHQVGSDHGEYSSTSEQFLSHMRYLSEHGYRTLTSTEYETYAMGEGPPPVKAALITFDDGFANTFTNAFPILERFGMHAVVFVITQKVGDGPPRRGANEPAPDAKTYLRWAEIEKMVTSGAFQAHSHTHAHVPRHALPIDRAEHLRVLEEDLATSRRLLRERLGATGLNHLAWPWGHSREDSRALARRLGFTYQYTVRNDFNTRATPLDQINRLCMDGKSLAAFVARLEFFRNSLLSRVYPTLRRKYDWMRGLIVER